MTVAEGVSKMLIRECRTRGIPTILQSLLPLAWYVREWYNGSTLASQAKDASSLPAEHASVVQWQYATFPRLRREFDSRHSLHWHGRQGFSSLAHL